MTLDKFNSRTCFHGPMPLLARAQYFVLKHNSFSQTHQLGITVFLFWIIFIFDNSGVWLRDIRTEDAFPVPAFVEYGRAISWMPMIQVTS
ncbi:MAG: hypothetical protein CL797_00120 [Chromatiales bacterium]|nr:hypothetical protein [Chromatiales bacterium]